MTELNLCIAFNFILQEFRMSKKKFLALGWGEFGQPNGIQAERKKFRFWETSSDWLIPNTLKKLINSRELQGKDESKVTQYNTSNNQTTSDTELEW